MPKNENVKAVDIPIKKCFGEEPETRFVNHLDAIKVELVDCPTMEQMMSYLPSFTRATWNEKAMCDKHLSDVDKVALVRDVIFGKTLPTAQETIGLTFAISGIEITAATHLIRYRGGSFSADCSADKWWNKRDCLVPGSIENSPELFERWKKNVEDAKQLYCDMIDTKNIPIADARGVLPRNMSTFYFMRVPLGGALHFIKQRMDRQMQPETDNVIAYQMYLEILRKIPVANGLIDIDAQDKLYIALGEEHGKMYLPECKNDVFEWNEENFLYQKLRKDMNGTDPKRYRFGELFEFYCNEISEQEKRNDNILLSSYGVSNFELNTHKVARR